MAAGGRERLCVATASGPEVGLQLMREHLASLLAGRVSVGKTASGGAAPCRGARSGRDDQRRAGGEGEPGGVGQPAAGVADQAQHGLAGVTHDLADAVEEHEAQALGPGVVQLRRQGDPLEGRRAGCTASR